ncbi:MAG TPA: PQQ-binding-like beta-propeller repeat protein [Bacillota bacterium]|nr:PQQ-binding-like beta-propeller repeat protein [Bacillota bacterium]
MKRLLLIALTVALLVTGYSSGAFAQDSVTFGHNFSRQRCDSEVTLPPSEQVWTNDKIGESITQPVIVGDKIFHASNRWLWELPLTNGSNGREKRLFEIDTGERVTTGSHPSFLDNVIYVGSKNGNLYGFDLIRKRVIASKKVAGNYGVVSSPLVVKNSQGIVDVVVGSSDGQALYIFKNFLNPAVTTRLTCTPGGNITSSPSQVNSNVFVFATNHNGQNRPGQICFYDLKQQKLVWTHRTDNGIPSSVAVAGGLAYAIDKTGKTYCLDFQQRRLKWSDSSYTSSGTFANFSPAIADGKVFFPIRRTTKYGAKGNGILTARNQQTGKKIWSTPPLKGEITTSPVVWSSAGVVLVGTSKGYIYGFDVDTGQPKGWFTKDSGQTISSVGQLAGVGSNARGNIRPDGITTEFAIANGYLLVGGKRASGQGTLCAFKLTGSDVALTSLTADNVQPQPGIKVAFRVTLENRGDQPRSISFQLTDNATPFRKVINVYGVQAGKTVTSYVYDWIMPAGQAKVTAKILSPAGGTKFNYLAANDSRTVVLQAGVDLALSDFVTPTTVFTGDTRLAAISVTNHSGTPITSSIKFLQNNNGSLIPPQQISLKPDETQLVSVKWTAPATAGTVTLKAVLNPNRNQPLETDYSNNTSLKQVEVNNQQVSTTGGRLTLTAAPDPAKTKAGYGFELNAATKTEPYIYHHTHTRVVNGQVETYTDTHQTPCPGARGVKAYFPDGSIVDLEPTKSLSQTSNSWRLPPSAQSSARLRKHYIPSSTPDGAYQVKLVAWGAGKNGNLTAQRAVVVLVEGTLYDDVRTLLTE